MNDEVMKGYKVFSKDWICRGKQYTCPGRFQEEGELEVCDHGMHFCLELSDCFSYYRFDPENHVAEVIAHGNIAGDGDKCCTDDLEIVREIPWQEVLTIVNIGKSCTGLRNTGDWNTGDRNTGNRNTGDWNTGNRNTGDWNTGNRNTGDRNTGDWNTGDRNTGNRNTGDRNTGNRNTGNRNTGDRNTGDWNKTDYSGGVFNTEVPKMMMFNKPSDWTLRDWWSSDARSLLNQIPKNVVEWVWSSEMTDEEKAEHPSHKTTDGYLKVLDESECGQIWWDGLSKKGREIIRSLPNFDADIFEQCTGIKIEGGL